MKLIDILVEELPKRGGWPEGADYVVQDNDGSLDVKFGSGEATLEHDQRGVWVNDMTPDWGIDTHESYIRDFNILACDSSTTIITREQYEAALAAKNDGWIEWGGGECPVPRGTLVDVRYRDGNENHQVGAGAPFDDTGRNPGRNATDWENDDCPLDIIAYRLHKPQEAIKADDEADLNDCIGQAPAPVWSGEGLPPVGCECEYSLNAGVTWWKCKIDYIVGTQGVVMLCDTFEGVQYVQFSSYGSALKFRPIRSEADKKREEAIMSLAKYGGAASFKYGEKFNDGSLIGAAWYELYDAIAAGKIPGVKLED